jgi:anti-sigma regulatory factor (Ser/Thr protein kinase)
MDERIKGIMEEQSRGGKSGPLRLTLDLPEGAIYVPSLRRTVRCLLESVGVSQDDADDVELVLGELATNAVIHSHSAEGYRVEVELTADAVLVTVTDRGAGFPTGPLSAPGTLRSPHPMVPDLSYLDDYHSAGVTESLEDGRFGGWGLPLVRRLADRVEILPNLPHGTMVRAEKRLENPLGRG